MVELALNSHCTILIDSFHIKDSEKRAYLGKCVEDIKKVSTGPVPPVQHRVTCMSLANFQQDIQSDENVNIVLTEMFNYSMLCSSISMCPSCALSSIVTLDSSTMSHTVASLVSRQVWLGTRLLTPLPPSGPGGSGGHQAATQTS